MSVAPDFKFSIRPDHVFDWGTDEDGTEVFGGEVGGYDIFVLVRPPESDEIMGAGRKVTVLAHEDTAGWPDHNIVMSERDFIFPEPWSGLSAERKLELIHGVGMFTVLKGLDQKMQGVKGVNYV